MTRLLRVLVIEEQSNVSGSVREYIEANFSPVFVMEIEHIDDGLAMLKEWSFDIILLDVDMPGMDGIEMIRRISSARSQSIIIILSSHRDAAFVDRAIQAGASGFAIKENASFELSDRMAHMVGPR